MAITTEHVNYPLYPGRVDGPFPARNIETGDWRDPDRVFSFDGCRVVARDADPSGHSEPDWGQGWFLAKGDQEQPLFEAKGRPPEFLVDCWKNGRVLYGVLIGRDEARHGR